MPNRLAHETSPYLLQHADNPVEWYPWGEEALALARRENRPILLSVGYSACHWCHVMAHESFEDPEVAARMNRWFVNVKVDREERPDIDHIYQTAHQLLTRRSGGWPLTMFLDPTGRPFYGGTYFPKEARYHLPGFGALLERVARAWVEQRDDIDRQNDELVTLLAQTVPGPDPDGAMPDAATIQAVRDALVALVDDVHGGLGSAPKFPHPSEFEFLMHRAAAGDDVARSAVRRTFTGMAEGGIFDHLAGGFCRYSTDREWSIPHFEKMLYDNAALLRLFADAWLVFRDPVYARVCEETAGWVMREMQMPEGGYASSLDADSEGEEGRFYVWHVDEVRGLLDADTYRVVALRYGLDRPPNFEGNHWHLRVARTWAAVAAEAGSPEARCEALVDAARERLLAVRSTRVRPDRDDKILTGWNALMIEAMAHAGRVFGRSDWLASARRALGFVHRALWVDGRLLATHKDGRSHLNAYLDDHAFLLSALLELLQSDFDAADLAFARAIADALLVRYEDAAAGGFWFTSHDHEALILRTKTAHDEATPAGNGVAARALQRLGHLTGDPRYLTAAERTLRAFAPEMARSPAGHASLAMALEEWLAPPAVVVLRGPSQDLPVWTTALGTRYRPGVVVIPLGDAAVAGAGVFDKPFGDRVNAWLCRAVTCLPPMATSEQLLAALGEENADPDISTAPQTS
jgi:uncharacterized protein